MLRTSGVLEGGGETGVGLAEGIGTGLVDGKGGGCSNSNSNSNIKETHEEKKRKGPVVTKTQPTQTSTYGLLLRTLCLSSPGSFGDMELTKRKEAGPAC